MSDIPRSAADKAMALLFLHDGIAGNRRSVHRALLVDNGERGSAQKAATFDADDLSALMQDVATLERALAEARERWTKLEAWLNAGNSLPDFCTVDPVARAIEGVIKKMRALVSGMD